jgi:hypothetical protein
LEHPVSAELTHRYCSHKCRQRAYLKRGASMTDEPHAKTHYRIVMDNGAHPHVNAVMSMPKIVASKREQEIFTRTPPLAQKETTTMTAIEAHSWAAMPTRRHRRQAKRTSG